ncbi:MAG: hypothetical protein ACP5NP_08030 [Acetobacteraceae bacterium]
MARGQTGIGIAPTASDAAGRYLGLDRILEDLGIIHGSVPIGDFDMPPSFQRREHHEQVGCTVALVLIIMPREMAWLHRDRHARFGDELL